MENISFISLSIIVIFGTSFLFFVITLVVNLSSNNKNKVVIKKNTMNLSDYINSTVEEKSVDYAINEIRENKLIGINSLHTKPATPQKEIQVSKEFVYVEISKLNEAINKGLVDRDIIDKIINSQNLGKSQIHIPKNRLDEILQKLKSNKTPIYTEAKVVSNIDEPIRCPKCSSTQITAEKKGYSSGKALAGALVTGGIGLLAGFHGSGNIKVICLKCGNSWKPKG